MVKKSPLQPSPFPIFWFSLIAIIFAFILLGTSIYRQTHQLRLLSLLRPSARPTPTPTPTWSTYRSAKYNFELKYPGNLTVNETNSYNEASSAWALKFFFGQPNLANANGYLGEGVYFDLYARKITLPPESWLGSTLYSTGLDFTDKSNQIKLGNNIFYIIPPAGPNNQDYEYITFANSTAFFFTTRGRTIQSDQVFRSIMSSLNFTDTKVICGGIANIKCPSGYECQIIDKHPDASGQCIAKLTKQFSFIKKIYRKDNKVFIDADYAQMLDDNSAPNGYRISNTNPTIRALQVSPNVEVSLVGSTPDGGIGNLPYSFAEFDQSFRDPNDLSHSSFLPQAPYWLFLDSSNQVVKIEQQYLP